MSMTRTSAGLSTGKKVVIGIVVMIVVILLGLFLWVTNVEKAAPEFSYKVIEPNNFVSTILNTTKYNATTKNLTLTLSHNLINSYMEQMRLETTAELPSYMSVEGIWLNLYNSRLYVKVKMIGITTTLTIPIEAASMGNSIRITWDRIYLKRV